MQQNKNSGIRYLMVQMLLKREEALNHPYPEKKGIKMLAVYKKRSQLKT